MTAPEPYDVDEFSDYQVARLLAALYPTRVERVIERTAYLMWWLAGPTELLSGPLDRLRRRLQTRRVLSGRHLAGRRHP